MGLGRDLFEPLKGRARTALVFAAFLSASLGASAQAQDQSQDFLDNALQGASNVMLVVDGSGSMNDAWTDDLSKFEAAQQALTELAGNLPTQTKTGVVTFGHRRNFDCADIEVLSNPVSNASVIDRVLGKQSPPDRGMRPLADAIETAAARLSQQDGAGSVIVVTDGAEECGGNSCALAGPLSQLDIPVHIIGLGMKAADASLLRCLPANTAGSFSIAEVGENLRDPIAQAFAKAHTANAQRSAATIARLLLQEQDLTVRDLTRVRGDISRLDDAVSALEIKVTSIGSRDVLTEELQPSSGADLGDELAVIREAADRLKAQLGSRDQMLIRIQDRTSDWNAGTLGLNRQAELAGDMVAFSETVTEPAEKLQLGHQRIVDRRAALETEIAATSALSVDLHTKLDTLQESLFQISARVTSAQTLAASIENGTLVEEGAVDPALRDAEALAVIIERDRTIADLRLERNDLMEQLRLVRAELAVSQEDVLMVEKQRATAETKVQEARDLLSSLQANQLALQSNWKSEIDNQSIEHLQARQAIQSELESVLAGQAALKVELSEALATIDTLKADNLSLVAQRDEARSLSEERTLALGKFETQNASLMNGLSQCRMGQEDLSNHIAALEADINAARALAGKQAPDSVRLLLAEGVEIADLAPSWSIEDPITGETLSSGEGPTLELPKDAGPYRVVADLGGQLQERTFSVRAFERQDHDFALNLARLDLNLRNNKAEEGVNEAFLVKLESPVFAQEIEVTEGEAKSLFLPIGDYRLSTDFGLTQWSAEQSLAAGEVANLDIEVNALPLALDLVAGDREKPLSEDIAWYLRDARAPTKQLAFSGPKADVMLAPGVYDVEVAFEGFMASQTIFVDADGRLSEPLQETVRFNDGAVRLAFSNNGEAVPADLDLEWRIELGGAAIVTSQTLDGDTVQLPAGGYHLNATANDVQIERDFLVLAGQITELAPDFSLGQVTLRLIGDSGDLVPSDSIDWSIVPQGTQASGFAGSAKTGEAIQTLLLPEGRYRVMARTGDTAVQRLISVKSGDKASFGLIVPGYASGGSLAQLGLGE